MRPESSRPNARLANSAFRDHAVEVKRYLLRRIGNAQDADDLSQEVFARLLRIKDAELVRKPLAYLLGIATHVVREFRQRRERELVVYDSDVADELCELPDGTTSVMAEQLDLTHRLDLALAQLPATHKLVLLLVKRDGLSYGEAAKASGLSVHTIEKYLVEARARLRVTLSQG